MFTGIIQKIGTVKRISRGEGLVVEIGFEPWARPLEEGESVAVNGVCLTVAKCDQARFTADVLDETVSRTGIGDLIPGEKVNLERALRAGDSMGGHIVQGHVDCRGTVKAKVPKGRDFQLQIRCGRVLAAQSVMTGLASISSRPRRRRQSSVRRRSATRWTSKATSSASTSRKTRQNRAVSPRKPCRTPVLFDIIQP